MSKIEEQVKAFKAKLLEDAKKEKEAAKAAKTAKAAEDASKPFWDKEQVLGMHTAATGKSAIRVAVCTKDDKLYTDLRKFVHKKGEAEGTFGQHTISGISFESLDDINKVIADLQRAAAKMSKAVAVAK